VEAPAVEIEESDDVQRRDLGVEGVGILQVIVPHFVHDVAEKFGASSLSGFVVCEVLEFGFVCCFRFDTDDSSGIVGDGSVIERERRAGRRNGVPPWAAAYLAGSVRRAVREWIPPTASNGMIMRMGRRTSRIERRSSSVGFPSMGGKTSNASLKRRVTASGRIIA
jgi:hypothetical protein